ncbi:N-acetylglucosaminyldiphosphodolichol N-acetylglucosaminyltransferase catalytic subunit alg13 [Puccinia graminis f. sp. tritici]|uniref:UDP-N-acetylglucosamine transferase subunit ALG13 n=1 Tax=Puccinia graminis f. sp. tritici TaxID=56615 RepID=A0A5B0RQA2_PUCGR|nr:N-acetylglucosaminyldiphosphodolichol N-acetylglucosaminyltransferase catalytic subunit alg13 [Puccinia graminis f. sp. tritici]
MEEDEFFLMVITVGSTNFEALINKLLNNQLIQILPPSNIKLLIQIGNQPKPETANLIITNHNNIQLVIFNYSDSIDHLLQHANLIITHAGAGSILSAINPIQPSPLTTTHIQVTPEYTLEIKPTTTTRRPKPRVIVVPNPGLMDNHQIDLAQQISNLGLAYSCSIESVLSFLSLTSTYIYITYYPFRSQSTLSDYSESTTRPSPAVLLILQRIRSNSRSDQVQKLVGSTSRILHISHLEDNIITRLPYALNQHSRS